MNVIGFCVYGNKPMYTHGMLENIKLAKNLYPNWKVWVYVSPSLDKKTAREYKNLGAEVFLVNEPDNGYFMLYRYFPLCEESVVRAIFRDADSRLNEREAKAVEEWIHQDTDLHLMRDHPYHTGPAILGGMWGAKSEKLRNFKEIIKKYSSISHWERNVDQYLLHNEIYPMLKNSMTIHDEIVENKPFPTERKNYEFVGCQYDENNKIIYPEHLEILEKFLKEKKK